MDADETAGRRAALKARLAEVRRLTAAGARTEARARLDALAADPGIADLGQITAAGMPRQVQAAFLRLAKAEGDVAARIALQYRLVPPPEVWARHFAPDPAARAARLAADRQEVPRRLHQVWIGDAPPPATTEAWRAHAAARGYEYRLWREADLAALDLPGDPAYRAMLAQGDLPGAVDVARYHILAAEGGGYLDCDWYPARRDAGLHDLLPMFGLTLLAEEVPRLTGFGSPVFNNAFIAVPPGHPVMRRLVTALPGVVADLPGAPAWWATGPLALTAAARGGPVTVAPPDLVAGQMPATAGEADLGTRVAEVEAAGGGLLLGWKPWAA